MLHHHPANGRQTMPNGPTTYPTLSGLVRNAADGIAEFYPATKECLTGIADSVEEMATELARTRRELADTDALAADRLAAIDDLRVELTNQKTLTRVANARVADRTHKLTRLVAYADSQPCACSEHELRDDPDAEPCDRCKALGRVLDEPVDQ